MITCSRSISVGDVAEHYNALDQFYRELWGDHLHHGLWQTGQETRKHAVEQLVHVVAKQACLRPGDRVCDVGCGYGATARLLARVYGTEVTGLTISQAQLRYALNTTYPERNPRFLLENWECNRLESDSFDAIVSIECLAHMQDKQTFFDQIQRVLRSGGRAVVTAWLAKERPRRWESRWLLEPICREGGLPSMGSQCDYTRCVGAAGLRLVSFDDLSRNVRKTWRICGGRLLGKCLTRASYLRYALQRRSNWTFALTIWRIWLAYRLGAMRYGMFVIEKN